MIFNRIVRFNPCLTRGYAGIFAAYPLDGSAYPWGYAYPSLRTTALDHTAFRTLISLSPSGMSKLRV